MERPTKEWVDSDMILTMNADDEDRKEYMLKCKEIEDRLKNLPFEKDHLLHVLKELHQRRKCVSESYKAQMNEWDNTVVYCECGGKYKYKGHHKHLRTKKHTTYLAK